MNIDFGNLSTEQTKTIARRALQELSTDEIIEVIKEAMHEDDREELIARLTK